MKGLFWKRQRFYKRYIVYYLIVFILPLSMLIGVYADTYKRTLNKAYADQCVSLNNASSICRLKLQSIKDLANQLSTDYNINLYMQSQNSKRNPLLPSEIIRILPQLAAYVNILGNIDELQISFQKSESILTNKTAYTDPQVYYDAHTEKIGLAYQSWKDSFFKKPVPNGYTFFGDPKASKPNLIDRILYSQTMYKSSADNRANLYIYLKPNYLIKTLENANTSQLDFVAFIRQDGKYISSHSFESEGLPVSIYQRCNGNEGYFTEKIQGKMLVLTYKWEEQLSGYYIAAIAEEAIFSNLQGIQILFGILLSVTLLCGLVLIILFSYHSAKPIVSLIGILTRHKEPGKDIYSKDFINQEVLGLIQEKNELRTKVDEQLPVMRISLYHKLLSGLFRNTEEIHSAFSQIGIDMAGSFFAVVILSVNDIDDESNLDEITAYTVLLNDFVTKSVNGLIGFYRIDLEKEAIIIKSENINYVDFLSELEEIAAKVEDYARDIRLNISLAGSLTDSVDRICIAFREATIAQYNMVRINNFKIRWYNKAKASQADRGTVCYYPITLETQMLEALCQGNTKECVNITHFVYGKNANEQNQLKKDSLLVTSMILTLYRFIDECAAQSSETLSAAEACVEKLKLMTAENVTSEVLCELLTEICECQHKLPLQASLISEAMELISLNYTDSRLSLSFISEKLKVTEVYLSHIFKESTNINFTRYVEKLRMQKAQELLFGTKQSISEIAAAVGYNSPQSFRRVYKKHFGKTPRE